MRSLKFTSWIILSAANQVQLLMFLIIPRAVKKASSISDRQHAIALPTYSKQGHFTIFKYNLPIRFAKYFIKMVNGFAIKNLIFA